MKAIVLSILLVLSLQCWAQDPNAYQKARFLFDYKQNGTECVVKFKKSEYWQIQYAVVSSGQGRLMTAKTADEPEFNVNKGMVAWFWLIGRDTVAVKVTGPYGEGWYPPISVNGRDLVTGRQETKKHWSYDAITPVLDSY